MTLPLDSIHERLLQGCKQAVDELELPGLPPERVYIRNMPDEKTVQYPCVFVTPGTEPETEGDSDFTNDYIIYPVGILIGDRAQAEDVKARPLWLGWRHKLMRHFRGMDAVAGVPECHDVRVSPGVIADDTLPGWFAVRSGFTALCHTTEEREPKRE